MFGLFGPKVSVILAPLPRTEPTSPALAAEVLATVVPEKSLFLIFFLNFYFFISWGFCVSSFKI